MKNKLIRLKDYERPVFLISKTKLYFDLQEGKSRVRSKLEFHRNAQSASASKELVLNGIQLKLISLKLDGKELKSSQYQCDDETLKIHKVPDHFILEVETEIEPEANKTLMGLYQSRGIYCTQCESHGFRRMTYFLDRPDVMSRFSVEIEADKSKYPVLLSNGNLKKSTDLKNGRHRVLWEDPFPKPCYLFALVAGDLGVIKDFFITRSKRKVELRVYVEKGHESQASFAMESLKKAMKWDEVTFGLEYDLDLFMIAAVDDFNFGAMENKGLNIFNSQYVLANPSTATDQNFKAIEGVIGHEYFHNWTGNRVTCRDWFQITLKEGLTVFRDQEFSADMNSRSVKRIEDVRFLKDVQFAEDASPNSHPIQPKAYLEVNNFYTSTVYQKGAEVIRMIETLIGKDNFKKGITQYFELFDGQAVTTNDFVHAMELASGMDLKQFRNWYDVSGTPVCRIKTKYHPAKKLFEMQVTQKPLKSGGDTKKEALLFYPFRVALLDQKKKPILLDLEGSPKKSKEKTLVISKKSQVFRFHNVSSRPVPSLLRGFSAPVKLETDLSREDQLFLLAHDTDEVNRYEAAQTIAETNILNWVRNGRGESSWKMDPSVIRALKSLLQASASDPAFVAECLIPPSESFLNEQLSFCEFQKIHQARIFWMSQIALHLKPVILELCDTFKDKGAYAIDPRSVGRRMLRNVLLRFLFLHDRQWGSQKAAEQYFSSKNMTDAVASLSILTDSERPEREEAFSHFYSKWKSDTLVMNKWFALQAISDSPEVLDRIQHLEKDELFNPQNPNKARALYGVFASNLIHFHDPSGKGYDFLSEKMIQIDDFNPGLAARLAGSFKHYPKVREPHRSCMKSAIERVLRKKALSKDVFEILSKTLKVFV